MKCEQFINLNKLLSSNNHLRKKDQKVRQSLYETTRVQKQDKLKNYIKRNSTNSSYNPCLKLQDNSYQSNLSVFSSSVKQNSKSNYKQNYFQYQHEVHQSKKQINTFSQLKNKSFGKSQKKYNFGNNFQQYCCQNHRNQFAKFYICVVQQNTKQSIHYYCLKCAINLSQMNFNVFPIKNQIKNYQTWTQLPLMSQKVFPSKLMQYLNIFSQQQLSNQLIDGLIFYKTALNMQSQSIKNQQNLQSVQRSIQETQQKYTHITKLLEQIKNQQIYNLERIKIKIQEFIQSQQKYVSSVKKKIQYLIWQYARNSHQMGNRYQQQRWRKQYQPLFNNIQLEIQNIMQSNSKYPLKLNPQLTIQQVIKKLQQLFSNTVHQLSFQASLQSQPIIPAKICSKITQKIIKNSNNKHRYQNLDSQQITKINKKPNINSLIQNESASLAQIDQTKKSLKFNCTFGKINTKSNQQSENVISGIDVAMSISGYFGNQQNFMINI